MNVALLIIGFDGYKDVWDSYFELLNKYWPVYRRPKTYLATEVLKPNYEGVNIITSNESSEWSEKTRNALMEINEDYVVLLLEDFFTTKEVNTKKLIHIVELMKENDLKFCRLLDQKKMKGISYKNEKHIKIIPKDDKYGLCLEPAIWNKAFLLKLIGEGNYNPWIFEFKLLGKNLHNQQKIDAIQDDSNILEITHGIVQSKYLPKAIKVFKKQGYTFDLSTREVLSTKDNFKYNLKCFVNFHSPEWSKKLLKTIGRLMGVDFVSDRLLGGEEK